MVNSFSAGVCCSVGPAARRPTGLELVPMLLFEQLPGRLLVDRHAQGAVGRVVVLRIGKLNSRKQHADALLVEACCLGQQVLTRQFVTASLAAFPDALR